MTSEIPSRKMQSLMQEAVAAQQGGDFATAETRYREILRVMPGHADATHFLGLLAHQTGHAQAARDLLQRAIALGPHSALYRHNLAGVLREQSLYTEADARYREAIALKHDYADAWTGLAMSQAARNQFAEALTSYRQAVILDQGNFEARLGCGAMLLELTQRSEALAWYREIQAQAVGDAEQLHRLGLAWREAGEAEAAQHCFEAALKLRPEFVEAHNSLGIALGDQGDFTAAERHYREALRLRPDYVSAWHNLLSMKRIDRDDTMMTALQTLSGKLTELAPSDAGMLHFVLGKVHDDAGHYAQAFEHFIAANRLKRKTLDYDESRQARFFHDFIRCFDSGFMTSHADSGAQGELPIFIIGMSRSGTTLVEQILASHPQVHGGGELQLLRRCIHRELGGLENEDELPVKLAQLDSAGFSRIGGRYLAALAELAPDAAHITDKLPGNMALVGLIHLAFPGARIIHCVRESRDTCVSCFSKLFTTGHAFSYELGELGRFYRLYQDLMQHWRTVLPAGRMLEIHYENLITDTEIQARRLLEFCGLPWDDRCLRFNETRRTVKTASLAQVRQPIYTSSQGRWQHYRAYLEPLERALAGN